MTKVRRRARAWVTAVAIAAAPAAADVGAGLRLLDSGDEAGARAHFTRDAAEASLYLALVERGEARKTAAERAAALAPADATWIRDWANALLEQDADHLDRAEVALRGALAGRAGDARLAKALGDVLQREEKRVEARDAYRGAVAANPSHLPALLALGEVERQLGDFTASYNAFNHAVGDDGRPASALVGRGTARYFLGDRDGALADLDRAAQIALPGMDRYRAYLATVGLYAMDRKLAGGLDRGESAVAMWQELGRADMAAAAANAVGRLLLETGQADAAGVWYDRGWQIVDASPLKPEEKVIWHVRQLHGRARVAAHQRSFDDAQQLADQAKALMDGDPANAEHYRWIYPYLVGYLRYEQRKYNEAIEALQQSDTDRPYIQYLIADSYARLRDRATARGWFQKALAGSTGLDSESAIVRPLATAWLQKNPG
ncbi:MAG: hypothetical protein U0X73_02935 [Thermoanaerobaculia bacterium]